MNYGMVISHNYKRITNLKRAYLIFYKLPNFRKIIYVNINNNNIYESNNYA